MLTAACNVRSPDQKLRIDIDAINADDGARIPPHLPSVYRSAIALILEHGWDVLHGGENEGPSWTALHWAACEGRLDVCRLLLQASANPRHTDELGKTALEYAIESGQHSTAALLHEACDARFLEKSRKQSASSFTFSPMERSKEPRVDNRANSLFLGSSQFKPLTSSSQGSLEADMGIHTYASRSSLQEAAKAYSALPMSRDEQCV